MKQYIGMIEVLGESGELQPLYWNPKHLVDGRAILVVDEVEAIIWVWLGRGTSMLQRTTALRQARFIMKNGIHVDEIHFGTKCTNFVEVPGDLTAPKAALLQKLLQNHQKISEYLIVIESEERISTFEESFQEQVDAIEQTIVPEPVRRATPIRRRILTYEEQLASKVLFAVADCYGQATMKPVGPNEFQVSVLRLQLRFFCQGDAILFSEIRATAQEDIDAFARCFGQQPELTADGKRITLSTTVEDEHVPAHEEKITSVVDSMREQLSQLSKPSDSKEANKKELPEEDKPEKNAKSGSSDFDLFG